MRVITTKLTQKRLDSCVFDRPTWTKIRDPRRRHTCGTVKIDDPAPDAAVRVENAHENSQDRGNTKLLGKCQLTRQKVVAPHSLHEIE